MAAGIDVPGFRDALQPPTGPLFAANAEDSRCHERRVEANTVTTL